MKIFDTLFFLRVDFFLFRHKLRNLLCTMVGRKNKKASNLVYLQQYSYPDEVESID